MKRIRRKITMLTPDELAVGNPLRHPWAALAWGLSVALGRLTGIAIGVVLLFLALAGTFNLRIRVASLLPEWVVGLFTTPLPEDQSRALEKARTRIKEELAEAGKRTTVASVPKRAYFTAGSSKQEVLAIQGTPTSISEDAWWYGASEVRFSGGRVVSWANSASDPLKAR